MGDAYRDQLDSEREWRRYIIDKLDRIETAQGNIRQEISELKLWGRVWRVVHGAALTLAIAWIRAKLFI